MATITVPISSARGMFFLESFSSLPMEVAQIQPSKAKARETIAPNRPSVKGISVTTLEKLNSVMPLVRPTMVPTTAISSKGISLMMVVAIWNLPASLGARAFMV